MNIKRAFMIGILLLVILTTGAVCASEDAGQIIEDNSSSIDDGISTDETILKENASIEMYPMDRIVKGEESEFSVNIVTEKWLDGNLKVTVGDDVVYDKPAQRYYNDIPYSVLTKNLGNKFGLYDVTVGLYNDSFFNDFTRTWKFDYNYYSFEFPSMVPKDSYGYLDMYFAPDAAGKVTLYLDGKKTATETISDGYIYFDVYGNTYGKHTYKIVFESSKNTGVYKSFTKSGSYDVDYQFEVTAGNDSILYGEEVSFEVYLPWDAKNKVNVAYGNKSRSYALDEEGMAFFSLNDLDFGENLINISYAQGTKYPSRMQQIKVNVSEILNVSSDVGYMSDEGIYLKLPADAKGNLTVIVDNITNEYTLENGTVKVTLSNYAMGPHELYVNYTGDDYTIRGFNGTFKVVANFIYSKNIYYKEGLNVTIALPMDANGTLRVSYDKRYKVTQVINGTASIQFDNLPAYEGEEFVMEYLNGNYPEFKKDVLINVREDSYESHLGIFMPDVLIYDDYEDIHAYVGTYGQGYVNVTVDGKFYDTFEVYENEARIDIRNLVKDLKMGNHTIQFDYSGDDYFAPATNTTTFELSFYRITTSGIVLLDEYSTIYVELSQDATGSAVLNINGKKIKGEIYGDEEYGEKSISFDVSKIPFGEYDAKIVYSCDKKYGSFTEQLKLNFTYDVVVDTEDEYSYGQTALLHFVFSINPKNYVNITVGDQRFRKYVNDNELSLSVDNLKIGQNNVIVEVSGNGKYPSKSFNWTVNVVPHIKVPEFVNIIDGGNVTLTLPHDANGSLVAEIYDMGILIKNYTQKLENGSTNVLINCSKLGNYEIIAYYTGDDYNVSPIDSKFAFTPKYVYSKQVYIGKTSTFIVELPQDANGKVAIYIGGEKVTADVVNGTASLLIPALKYLEDDVYYMYISYDGDSRYGKYGDDFNNYIDVIKYDAKITIKNPNEIIENNYATFTFTFPSDAKGYVMIEEGYCKISNGKASVKVLIPKSGSQNLYYYYSGDDKYKEVESWIKITALPAPKLTMKDVTVYYTSTATFKVKVLDSYGKIVSGKTVAFYVDGKRVKYVKTDKKGYAVLKLTKTPKVYKVKVTYKGGVVTKKLTVKHLVTLKTVKVKKSARKLVLKVTLKKGKKALKYKKITIKFNGKKYKIYTNYKGVAKITFTKKTLKKLKVGKTVTYQATYKKDTVKKTAKVVK